MPGLNSLIGRARRIARQRSAGRTRPVATPRGGTGHGRRSHPRSFGYQGGTNRAISAVRRFTRRRR